MHSFKYSLINIAAAAICFSTLSLAGCDEPAPAEKPASARPEQEKRFDAASRSWIDISDKISPAVWLASREAGRDVEPNDPAAASIRALLTEADARFTEGPRMIANRAVQVEAMLAERGVKETPREVIEGLVSIAGQEERAGFGETCQHYVNARGAGASRKDALETLSRQPLPTSTSPGSEEK